MKTSFELILHVHMYNVAVRVYVHYAYMYMFIYALYVCMYVPVILVRYLSQVTYEIPTSSALSC